MTNFSYTIKIHEGNHKIPVAAINSKTKAIYLAKTFLDDALPNNTVHVYEKGHDIGYAALAGDGSQYWKDKT